MSTTTDEAYATDEATEQKPRTALGNLDLQEFTPLRFRTAQLMGMRWPVGKDELRTDGGLYRGELFDAAYVLWLCSIPVELPKANGNGEQWSVKRARNKPDQAADAALQWGDEKGIGMPSGEAFWEAINLFEKMLVEVESAYTAEKGSDPKE